MASVAAVTGMTKAGVRSVTNRANRVAVQPQTDKSSGGCANPAVVGKINGYPQHNAEHTPEEVVHMEGCGSSLQEDIKSICFSGMKGMRVAGILVKFNKDQLTSNQIKELRAGANKMARSAAMIKEWLDA